MFTGPSLWKREDRRDLGSPYVSYTLYNRNKSTLLSKEGNPCNHGKKQIYVLLLVKADA